MNVDEYQSKCRSCCRCFHGLGEMPWLPNLHFLKLHQAILVILVMDEMNMWNRKMSQPTVYGTDSLFNFLPIPPTCRCGKWFFKKTFQCYHQTLQFPSALLCSPILAYCSGCRLCSHQQCLFRWPINWKLQLSENIPMDKNTTVVPKTKIYPSEDLLSQKHTLFL